MIENFGQEVKKLYIKKRFVLIFFLVLVISLISSRLSDDSKNFNISFIDATYSELIKDYIGPYDSEKDEMVKNNIDDILNQYYSNTNGTSSNYQGPETKEKEIKGRLASLRFIETQFNYSINEPVSRFIIDAASWNPFIANNNFEYPLIIFSILLGTIPFYIESQTGMDHILDSSLKSRRYGLLSKNLVILLSILLMVVILEGFKFSSGIPIGWSYPLASHPRYELTWLDISLGQFYILTLCLRAIGLFIISLWSASIMRKTRNVILSLLIPLLVNVFPFLLMEHRSSRFLIPANLINPSFFFSYSPQMNNGPLNTYHVFTLVIFVIVILIVSYIVTRLGKKVLI